MRQAKLLVMSTTMMLAACGGTKDAGQSAEALICKSDIKIEGMRMTQTDSVQRSLLQRIPEQK